LRWPGALEPLHLAFMSSGRLMRILRPVVSPSTGKAIDFKPGALLESVSGELGENISNPTAML
jgi:hypothetical protein